MRRSEAKENQTYDKNVKDFAKTIGDEWNKLTPEEKAEFKHDGKRGLDILKTDAKITFGLNQAPSLTVTN